MSGAAVEHRQARLLRELGVRRYRLRSTAVTSSGAGDTDVASTAVAVPDPAATETVQLRLYRAGGDDGSPNGPAALVWSQVLTWLGMPDDQVHWLAQPEPGRVALPACDDWLSPAGKRALYQALKFRAPER